MQALDEKTVEFVSEEVRACSTRYRFVAVDVETTGLQPQRGDRVIEIGAVVIDHGTVLEEFHSFIKVGKHIPVSVQRIHGITDDILVGKPTSEVVFSQFREFIQNSVLIAHNAEFDIKFLRYELSRLGLTLNNKYFCTLKMSRMLFPRLKNHKLETVYKHLFKKEPDEVQHHRALDDAKMVAQIWIRLGKE